MQAVEAGSHKLIVGWFGKEVTSQLITNEVVIAQVFVESPDYPIPVSDEVSVKVLMHSIGVGKTDQVQPVASNVFPILLLGQHSIDQSFVSLGTIVGEKVFDFIEGRWKARQVEGNPPD